MTRGPQTHHPSEVRKGLCFSIAWIRTELAKERTDLKWTNTENMFVDCGTKEMPADHVHRILSECRWSFRYSPDFVKQTIKSKKDGKKPAESLPTIGEPLDSSFAVFHHLLRLGDQFGWHLKDDMAIQVAKDAKSYRTPVPRFSPSEYPLRSSFGRFDRANGQAEWRRLENRVEYGLLANRQQLIGATPAVLVTIFHQKPTSTNKEGESAVKAVDC